MKSKNKNESYRKAFGLAQLNLWLDATNNVFNMKEDTSAVIVFESLKKAINKNIIKQIEDLKNPKRCVLLIDGDYNFISGIVSYVYYVHCCGRLHHVPCSVLNEKDIESWLYWSDEWCLNPNSPLIKFIKGETLFLRDLNSEYQHILKCIACWIRDLPIDKYGMLIISMDNVIDLPEEFKSQFEKIYLKTNISFEDNISTVTVNDNKYTDLHHGEYKLLKLLYNIKGEIVSYDDIRKKAFGSSTSNQQIQNAISNLKKQFNKYVDIENKRGVGYVMTFKIK